MDGTSGNLLLNSLTPGALRAFNAHEEQHDIAHVLITSDETPEFIFFPGTDAVVSIIRSTEDGWTVEAGVIGNEGLLNLQTVIATPAPTGNQAVVQARGRFVRTDARLVRSHFHENAAFRDRVLSFTNTFLGQVTQNLVCNRLHAIEQRLAKWILVMRDRTATDDLHLTHDFLSHMLGIHRPGGLDRRHRAGGGWPHRPRPQPDLDPRSRGSGRTFVRMLRGHSRVPSELPLRTRSLNVRRWGEANTQALRLIDQAGIGCARDVFHLIHECVAGRKRHSSRVPHSGRA